MWASILSVASSILVHMFDSTVGAGGVLTAEGVALFAAALRGLGRPGAGAAAPTGSAAGGGGSVELVGQLRALEELKSAAAAAQARVAARFAAAQRAAQRAAGTPAGQVGSGIGAQIALARRDSPARGSRHLGLAEALVHELPHTLAALEAGQISEWRATLVTRETACLSVEHRLRVDAELAARPGGLEAMGDKTLAAEARRVAYRLDPHAVTNRAQQAESARRVSLRPAPDTMSVLSGLLPVAQGVAAYTALSRHADSMRAAGDPRSRGQVMADTLVERVTGQAHAGQVPVEVHLVMTDRTLLAGDHEPADLDGYGPLPAPLARGWLRGDSADGGAAGEHAQGGAHGEQVEGGEQAEGGGGDTPLTALARVWLRRLYTSPDTGALVAMDTTGRCFEGGLRRFLITADRWCRTPWCDAPIRHADHIVPAAQGGRASVGNGRGQCEACNYINEAAGWATVRHPDRTVETVTPTGHRYLSRPPPPLGQPPPERDQPPPGEEASAPPPAGERGGGPPHELPPPAGDLRDLELAS
jgi:hypothetical protein